MGPGAEHQAQLHSLAVSTIKTPCGDFVILANSDGVLAAGFADNPEYLVSMISPKYDRIYIRKSTTHPAAVAVNDYMAGDLLACSKIPVIQDGSLFTKSVWKNLLGIAPGQVASYKAIAEQCGSPYAQRAVGSACSRNRAAIFIPCHRVVPSSSVVGKDAYGASNRTIGRYAYGTERKQWLLCHEGALIA